MAAFAWNPAIPVEVGRYPPIVFSNAPRQFFSGLAI
jgi:hypothetical protein